MGKKKNFVAKLTKYAERERLEIKFEECDSDPLDSNKRFIKRAVVGGQPFPVGVGNTKERAKQNAAKCALRCLNANDKENPRPVTYRSARNPTAPLHQRGISDINCVLPPAPNEYGQKNRVTKKAVESTGPEPNDAPQCSSFVVGDDEYPMVTGETKREAKEEAARHIYHEISGSNATEVPSRSALYNEGSPAGLPTPADVLVSDDGTSRSVAAASSVSTVVTNASNPSMDQKLSPMRTKRRIEFHDASQINEGVISPRKVKRGNTPDEKTSTQTRTFRNKSEFDFIDCLGRGGFGEVFKAKEKMMGKYFAVKIVLYREVGDVLREVAALSDLLHSNIVRLYSCWLEDSGYQWDGAADSYSSTQSSKDDSLAKYLFIQMELCDTKTLKMWINEINQKKSLRHSKRRKESLTILRQIVSGIEYIHSKRLIHRDLKPANILFGQDGEVKIGDFGLVTTENDDDAESLIERTVYKGTPSYMAPEQRSQKNYNRKVDIFALGLIYFELFWKISTVEREEVWDDIRAQKFPDGFLKCFYEEYNMIRPMLCVKPEDRPEASEIKTKLEKYVRGLENLHCGSKSV